MEVELTAEKTKSEWVVCSYGYDPKVTVCVRVENGDVPLEAKIIGLKGSGDATYVKPAILQKLFTVLGPFLQEVEVAKLRTNDDASEILLPQEQFAKVRCAERQRCVEIAESYQHTCSCHIADDIAALIRADSLK